MSDENAARDASLRAAAKHLATISDPQERDTFARMARVSLGFESQFRWARNGVLPSVWNWLIDADHTALGPPPFVWVISITGLAAVAVSALLFL